MFFPHAKSLELNYRRIAFVTDTPNITSALGRLKGYQDALKRYSVPYDPERVQEDNFNRPDPRASIEKLFALPHPPTAVLASSDPIAFHIEEILREAGLEIPCDISLVGFDAIPQASLEYRKLTTVHQPLYEMGAAAAHMLLEEIENPDRPTEHIELQTHLVVRGSTAPSGQPVETI